MIGKPLFIRFVYSSLVSNQFIDSSDLNGCHSSRQTANSVLKAQFIRPECAASVRPAHRRKQFGSFIKLFIIRNKHAALARGRNFGTLEADTSDITEGTAFLAF